MLALVEVEMRTTPPLTLKGNEIVVSSLVEISTRVYDTGSRMLNSKRGAKGGLASRITAGFMEIAIGPASTICLLIGIGGGLAGSDV